MVHSHVHMEKNNCIEHNMLYTTEGDVLWAQ